MTYTCRAAGAEADRLRSNGQGSHNLQLHGLSLKFNSSNLEVYANRADVALRVRVVRETKQ